MYQIVSIKDNPPTELVKEAFDTVTMLQRRYGKDLTAGGSKQKAFEPVLIVFLNWTIHNFI